MNAELIAVGTEIVLGQIENTHARFLSLDLAAMGIGVYFHTAVGDNEKRIIDAMHLAMSRSDIIIVTGGLGPTGDDVTRSCVAQALNLPLTFDEAAFVSYVLPYFQRLSRIPSEVQNSQAMRIGQSTFLPNPRGTAPGQYVIHEGKHIFLLPGPPLEMQPMYKEQVRSRLLALAGDAIIASRVIRFFGIGEADVESRVKDLLASQSNPTIAPLAGEGEVLLRITAKATTDSAAHELIWPVQQAVLDRVGEYVYGFDDDSVAFVTQQKLLSKGLTVAMAESCTGGLLTSLLVDLPGSSGCLRGSVVAYANECKQSALGVLAQDLKEHGAVSEVVAKAMAEGVRARFGSDFGLSVTGIAGPDGGTDKKPVGLVYIGLADASGARVLSRVFNGDRTQVRVRAAKTALHWLWKSV